MIPDFLITVAFIKKCVKRWWNKYNDFAFSIQWKGKEKFVHIIIFIIKSKAIFESLVYKLLNLSEIIRKVFKFIYICQTIRMIKDIDESLYSDYLIHLNEKLQIFWAW